MTPKDGTIKNNNIKVVFGGGRACGRRMERIVKMLAWAKENPGKVAELVEIRGAWKITYCVREERSFPCQVNPAR